MDKEQIDKLFRIMTNNFSEQDLCELIGLTEDLEKYHNGEIPKDEFEEKLFNQIINLLEQGDFDYFKTKINSTNENERLYAFALMSKSSNKDEIRKLIDKRDVLKIDSQELSMLIEGLGDSDFIKSIIENPEERKKYNLSSLEIKYFITSFGKEYIQECISSYIEGINDYGLNDNTILSLSEAYIDDSDIIAKVIKKCHPTNAYHIKPLISKIEKWNIDLYVELKEYIEIYNQDSKEPILLEDIIKQDEETLKEAGLRATELRLSDKQVADIIRKIDDYDYTKLALSTFQLDLNKNFSGVFYYSYIADIIMDKVEESDIEFVQQCIERNQELGLDVTSILKIIKRFNNNSDIINTFLKTCDFNSIMNMYDALHQIIPLVIETNNSEYAKKILDTYKQTNNKYSGDGSIMQVLISNFTKTPEEMDSFIEQREQFGFKEKNLVDLINSIHSPEYTDKWIEKRDEIGLSPYYIVNLINNINSPEYTDKWIEKRDEIGLSPYYIVSLINNIHSPEYTDKWIEKRDEIGLSVIDILSLINLMHSPEYTDKWIEKRDEIGLSSDHIVSLINNIHSPEYATKWLKNNNELNLSLTNINNILEYFSTNVAMDILKELNNIQIYKEYRKRVPSIQDIYDNLDLFLNAEGKIEYKDIIIRMFQKNNYILKADFDILDYIEYFGEEKVNLLSCFPGITKELTNLNDTKLLILKKCINYYEQKTGTEEWTILANKILTNINNINEDLLQKMLEQSKETEINVEYLIQLLIDGNNLSIMTLDEFNNYEEIKEQWCNKYIKSYDIEDCRVAVLEKIFDQNLQETQNILSKYGEDIDKIEDESLKNHLMALKEIIYCSDVNILREIYSTVEPLKNPSIIAIERLLKTEYTKLYNKELFKCENTTKNEEFGENVYDAGTEFSMIITSIGAYSSTSHSPENFEKDWNRPALASQHFCTSYIRNDMLGTAPIPFVCFGFESMKEDSLMLSGATDIWSSSSGFISTASHDEMYYSPDTQINNTPYHNEMCWRRIQGGEKKQPDYIVVFRKNGEIKPEHWEYAKQAQSDFGGNLPIVIVDKDKCLESERQKVEEMLSEYRQSPSPQLATDIRQKIRNNRVTDSCFGDDIDLSVIEEELSEEVTKEDLISLYKEVTPEERESETKKIADLIKGIEFER